MFTGLIQSLGKIRPLGNDRFAVVVSGKNVPSVMSDLAIGDSVAVDGVCLTVEEILAPGFVVTASPETLQKTSLGHSSRTGDYINLETSLRVGSKIGGHFVTGHVDGVGCLVESLRTQQAWEMCFGAPQSLANQWQDKIARYLIPKGSIAINGISLTVTECDPLGNWFKVAVIPHTYSNTNLCYLGSGSWVNLESDILGKYVNKLLNHRENNGNQRDDDVSLSFLAEHGYL